MPDPTINGEPISRRCRHCGNALFQVRINHLTLRSPFSKSDPAVVCEVCDAPGQLPVLPNA